MKTIVKNLAVEYLDEGSGKVILCLHGWQNDMHSFDALASLLSPTNRVIRLDLPGFGNTEAPKEAWGLDDYVVFLQHFIEKLNLDVDVLLGHSFGGRIIIKGVAERRFHSRAIVLIGSAGIAKRPAMRNIVLKVLAKIGKTMVSLLPFNVLKITLRKKFYKLIGSDYADAGTLRETFVKVISEDLSASAAGMTTRTLLIWGNDDVETPLSDGKQLARLIPHAQLKVMPQAGHFVHQEKPREVATLIQNFL